MRRDGNVAELLGAWAEDRPDDVFLWIGDEQRTFSEVFQEASALAGALAARGVSEGDRVAVMCPTSAESITATMAVALLAAISVPLNIFLKGEPLEHQLQDSGCSVLIADELGLAVLRSLPNPLPILRLAVVVGALPAGDVEDPSLVVVPYAEVLTERGSPARVLRRDPSDTYCILYTSGTTGLPKGCVISHAYTERWSRYTEDLTGLNDGDTIFTAAPQFHIGGITPLLGALSCGIPCVLEVGFSASKYLMRAKDTRSTIAVGVGWIAQALLKQPASESDRDHQLRAMSTVQLSVAEQTAFKERFGIRALTQQYGMTECYPISYNDHPDQRVSPHAGRPAADLIVEVHDDAGHGTAPGVTGEIVVRPRTAGLMFDRYWENPQATVEAFEGLWFHTGDVGCLLDGEIHYVDRKKDSMRRRGENVSAFELERTVLKWPGISEVAVHGVRVEGELDQSIKACVVLEPGVDLRIAEFAAFLSSELAYFAVPQFVEVMTSLPRNASGRVMKDLLREQGVSDSTLDLVSMGHGIDRARRRRVEPSS